MTNAIATISMGLMFFVGCELSLAQQSGSRDSASAPANGDRLAALEAAYKAGVITKAEFDTKKRELERPATVQGWQLTRNPAGFEIEHPTGWVVEALGEMRIVVRSPDARSVATIAPFVRGRGNCRDYIAETFAGQSGQFREPAFRQTPLSQNSSNRTTIENATQRRQRPDEVVAALTFENGASRGAALCSLDRGSGMFFVIAGPTALYEQQKAVLVRIVKSLKFGSPAGQTVVAQQPTRRPLQYSRWRDPSEGAFTIDVPAGWRVGGGLVRRSAIDVTGSVKMSSPDGASAIFLGDERLYNCITPEVVGASLREGQMYRNQATALMVLRYQPPLTFANNYMSEVQRTYGLSGIEVRDRREPPPATSGTYRVSYSELSFTAQRNGRQVAGFLSVSIAANPVQGGNGLYWTPGVAGFVTPVEDAGQIAAAYRHSIDSGQKDPAWARQQGETTMATSKMFAASSAETNDAISKSYWNTQASYDRTFQNDSDARRGQVRLRDPNTGEEFTATSGHNYYYRPAGGDERNIIGTDNTDRPNIDATELLLVR